MQTQAPWSRHPLRWTFINIGAWTILGLLFAVQGAAVRPGALPMATRILRSLVSFAPCAILTPFIAMIAMRFRLNGDERARPIIAHIVGASAFVVIGGAMMGAAEWLAGGRPDLDLSHSVREAVIGYFAFDVLTYVSIVAVAQAVIFAAESRDRAVSEATLLGQLAEARLHVLSSQLQPHFLFNTLNAISALVREEPQQAERLLAKLSDLLRHVLQDSSHVETSLAKELTFLEKYVELQEVRYGSRLSVQFEVDPNVVQTRVPHLLLQPLVENAIRHGTSRRPGQGVIEISARSDGAKLQLIVRDNGAGIPEDGIVLDGIGLSSTKARLRQLYGDNHTFALERVLSGGTKCSVSVPLTAHVPAA
ncbi:MAG: histidine kinase [Gemmatimonadaceae bacterium]